MKSGSWAGLIAGLAAIVLSGCVVQRTVTDEAGDVIYQEPELHTPYESDKKRREEVFDKELELGYY